MQRGVRMVRQFWRAWLAPHQREVSFVGKHVQQADDVRVLQLAQQLDLAQRRHVYALPSRRSSISMFTPCMPSSKKCKRTGGCTSLACPMWIFLMATTCPVCSRARHVGDARAVTSPNEGVGERTDLLVACLHHYTKLALS